MDKSAQSQVNLRTKSSQEIQQRGQNVLGQSEVGQKTTFSDQSRSQGITRSQIAFGSPQMEELYNKRKEQLSKHMDKLVTDNEAYFKLVRGGLVCGQCLRPKDLTLDYKKGAESLYQKDFKPHDCYKAVPRVGQAFFKSFDTVQPMELTTVNRTDYIPHPIEKNPSEKKKDVTQFLPFAGVSSYNDEFANWGSNPTSVIKPAAHPTVIKELPFMGRTLYSDEYKGKPAEKDLEREKIIQTNRRGQFKSPINPDFPFLPQTSYGTTYLPAKTSTHSFKPNQKFEAPLPPFAGQYGTTHRRDYTEKHCGCNDKNCIICGRKMKS